VLPRRGEGKAGGKKKIWNKLREGEKLLDEQRRGRRRERPGDEFEKNRVQQSQKKG